MLAINLKNLERQFDGYDEEVSNVSSLTTRSQELRATEIPEQLILPSSVDRRPSDAQNFLLSLKRSLKFSKFTLHFYDPVYEDRFQSYLLRQISPNSIFTIITLPAIINMNVLTYRLFGDIEHVSEADTVYIYCLMVFFLLTQLIVGYCNYTIKIWANNHGKTSVEADFPVKDDDEERGDRIPVHIRTPYFLLAYRTAFVGNCADILSTLCIGLYVIWRTYTGYCYGGCYGNFPMFTAGALFYVPMHFTLIKCCKYWVTITMILISLITLLISIFILFAGGVGVDSSDTAFSTVAQLVSACLIIFIAEYVVQYMRVVSFCQREILTQIVTDEERKCLHDIIHIWV